MSGEENGSKIDLDLGLSARVSLEAKGLSSRGIR